MRVSSESGCKPVVSAVPAAPNTNKIAINTKTFATLAGSGRTATTVPAMPSELPAGSEKKLLQYPTHRASADGPPRGSETPADAAEPGRDDALERWVGQLFDPLSLVARSNSGAEPARVSEPSPVWVSETIRRIAWGGDRRRGTARVELGGGVFEGACLQVHANGASLRIELTAPPGVDASRLAERIEARLAKRGLQLESLAIR